MPRIVEEAGTATGATALLLSLGLLVVGSIVVLALFRLRGRELIRAENARRVEAEGSSGPLVEGPAVVVGRVVGDDAPVVLRVDERGSTRTNRGRVTHEWREVGRQWSVRPFDVRRDDGLTVNVDPGQAPILVGDLVHLERAAPSERVRTARLEGGAIVRVTGELAQIATGEADREGRADYRGSAEGRAWKLSPSRGEAAFLSTKPLAATFEHRAGRWRVAALAAALWLVASQVALAGRYYVLSIAGSRSTATVVACDVVTYVRDGRATTTSRTELRVLADGDSYAANVPDFACEEVAIGDTVAVLRGPIGLRQLGVEPAVVALRVPLVLAAGVGAIVAFITWSSRRRRWWEASCIVVRGVGDLDASDTNDQPG